jgi:4-alpha-glucanotransferase
MIISLDELISEHLLSEEDINPIPSFAPDRVEFEKVAQYKMPLLRLAVKRFVSSKKNLSGKEYQEFLTTHEYWIDDYALYKALCDHYNDTRWYSEWDEGLAKRDEKSIALWKETLADEILEYKVLQFFFFKQWQALHSFATQKEIAIVCCPRLC